MATIRRLSISPPLLNSSSPWASEPDQLQELFNSPHTGAVTTRTGTLTGFVETANHTVVFAKDSISSCNSYGYSPHPLSFYLDYVEKILSAAPEGSVKPFIISISSSSPISLASMLDGVQELRGRLCDSSGAVSRVGVEMNTSCPNIKGSPPPAYNFHRLRPILDVLADYFWKDPTLAIGLKLPPYTYSTQFDDLVRGIASYSRPDPADRSRTLNPIAFLTSTNTLGQTILFEEQTYKLNSGAAGVNGTAAPNGASGNDHPALPTVVGGLAGESLHALSLGNVYTFRQLLDASEDEAVRAIAIVGVGGVTTREAHKRMRRAGAAVVELATLLAREGVKAFETVSIVHENDGSVDNNGGSE
ncbi:FMN-linked oxidoreductase [Auriscalpium vulgare]|uniref:FMN-linked oxidoreductase n=1 Tax=Auriscalpium vulgare TaxID=40419 RepID=A0ACB8RJR2_9AGAM|nr:FMN-linked oxidoreductase [Auriscalpium vulgare]